MIVEPYEGRAKIDYFGNAVTIKIPSKKNWFTILFLAAWLSGWYMGESSALSEVFSNKNIAVNGFMLFWLVGWTIGGFLAIYVMVWSLFGMEKIEIDKFVFKIEKGLLNTGILKKSYDLSSIKNLALNPEIGADYFWGQKKKIGDFWGTTGGSLQFDYGMKTITFGIGLDEAEARYLIDEIKRSGFYKDN